MREIWHTGVKLSNLSFGFYIQLSAEKKDKKLNPVIYKTVYEYIKRSNDKTVEISLNIDTNRRLHCTLSWWKDKKLRKI